MARQRNPWNLVGALVIVGGGALAWWLFAGGAATPPTAPTPAPPAEVAPVAPTTAAPSTALPIEPMRTLGDSIEPVSSGVAIRVGELWRLDIRREALGGAREVCLEPADRAGLGDVQPRCTLLSGWTATRALCARSDSAKAAPLTGEVRWRLCP